MHQSSDEPGIRAAGAPSSARREPPASGEEPEPRAPARIPRVTLHFAQSLDGRIATRSGAARWISGPSATRFAHELRAASDAVVVGSGTVLSDDPLLTVRLVPPASPSAQPLRVVLDARSRLPASAKLVTDRSARTIQATRAEAPSRLPGHVERLELPSSAQGDGIDLDALLAELLARGAKTVLVEGGHTVLTAFLRADRVDRIVVTIAPIVLGAGIDAVGDLGTESLEQARRFQTRRVWRLDDDVLVELWRAPPESG